ncbi:TIGR03943 family protein [Nocardioides fonticola]|uniref:TIGR03943 family protein n=1 Tax=Nocardioides fonticola TaxID=450363 RepID=A0ABP7XMM9_9ACTN
MTRRTQGLVLAFLGALLTRLSLTGEYERFVTTWMRWPLLVTGIGLVVLALPAALGVGGENGDHSDHGDHAHPGEEDDHGHRAPRSAWLLLLPGLVAFVVSPPALGAYLAERRASDAPPPAPTTVFAALPDDVTSDLALEEFLWRAQTDEGATLAGRDVRLTGFVSTDPDGNWYVTRLVIACCAADARPVRVRVGEADAPPRNTWVAVTGTWEKGTGTTRTSAAVLDAGEVTPIDPPEQVYE